ncbi:MAG TPA: TRAP transporter small permease subunit [Hyphomicrobiaceae bacterium]|nr:TRAP transporter small permease subunit [Hyphomicrobiaceae bacterium]
MRGLLAISNTIDRVLRFFAHIGAWFFLACIITICVDVLTRNGVEIPLGFTTLTLIKPFQLNFFGIDLGSTRLQELQWHFHAFLFLSWLGYAYVRNAHVRIDVATAGLSARKQAWMEVLGIFIFAIPYLIVGIWFSHQFFVTSFIQNESSAAPNGLGMRWIVKFMLYMGFWTVALAVISVLFRRLVFLFGSKELAEEALPGGNPGVIH